MKKLLMAVGACVCALGAQAAVMSYDYVHDGLVGYWDGRENVGRGQHSDSLAEWVDLIHGYRIVLYNTTAEADRVVFAGNKDSYGLLDANATFATFGTAVGEDGRCTVEFVYKADSGAIMLVQAPATSAIMIGQLGNAICFSQGPFDLMDYPASVQSLTNTVTALYSNSKVLKPYWLNATETGVNGSNYFNGDGSATTLIGKRSSNGICLNGSIYAIRVYNRLLSPEEIAANRAIDLQRFIEYVEPVQPAEPEVVHFPNPTDNGDLSATLTYFVNAGAGCDSAEVKVLWGRTPTELTKTTLLDVAAPHSTELTSVLKGLSPNTTYYAKLVAKNANGLSSESEVKSFATGSLREDEFGNGRPVWIASTNETGGAVTSFDLGFSTDGSFGEADLYVLYGSVVGGNTTDSWEHVERVTTIPADTSTYRYAVPEGFGSEIRAIRFALILVTGASDVYDDLTEYVESSPNATTVDTGIRGKAAADYWIDVEADIDIVSYPSDGGCLSCNINGNRCYLIYAYNGWCLGAGGYVCSGSGTMRTGRQKVQIYYHPGLQWIKVDDTLLVSSSTTAVDSGGTLALFQGFDIKLYSMNIYTNDAPARQYVGCRKDGVGGLYDMVTKTATYNTNFRVPDGSVERAAISFSQTYYCTDTAVPAVSFAETRNLTAHSFDVAGALSSFGGAREDCTVSLFLGFDGVDGAFAQYGESVVPNAEGSFAFAVTGQRGGTAVCWYAEIVSGSGEKVRTTMVELTTPSASTIKAKLTSISQSVVTFTCPLVKGGASDTDFILFAAPDGEPLVPRAHTVGAEVNQDYVVTWPAWQDADCDRNAIWRWEIRGVTAYEDEAWTNVVAGESTFYLRDASEYVWTGGGRTDADGWYDWFDAANWSTTETSEDKAGYPCSQYGLAKFTSGGDVKIRVSRRERLHKLTVEAENLKLHIRGVDANRSELLMNADYWGEADSTTGRRVVLSVKGAGTEVVLSDFAINLQMSIGLDDGGALVLDNCSLVHNGLTFIAPWYLNAAAGSPYGGGRFELRNGSSMTETNGDWWSPLCLAKGGEFVIDDSSFSGFVRYDFHLGGGKVRVAGANANLTASSFLTNQTPTEQQPIPHFGTGTLEFAMPENGFAGVPMTVGTWSKDLALAVSLAKDSPVRGKVVKLIEQPLVKVTGGSQSVPKDKMTFGAVPIIDAAFLYGKASSSPYGFQGVADFPSETAAKSIGVTVITKPGFMLMLR